MSIIAVGANGWVICHSSYLHDIYAAVKGEQICNFCKKYDIFHIQTQFFKDGQKKFKNSIEYSSELEPLSELEAEVNLVKSCFNLLMSEIKSHKCCYFHNSCPKEDVVKNYLAITKAKNILSTKVLMNISIHGGNMNSFSICISIEGDEYLIPPKCQFFSCQIEDIFDKLQNWKHDVILMDPPWWNKHIRRMNKRKPDSGYKMMYSESLLSIPIETALSTNGIIIVWCTNSEEHFNYLTKTVFLKWNVEFVSVWYWVKVTEKGIPICEFSAKQKKPYERIIFGIPYGRNKNLRIPEMNKVIISIPSAIHSHKPPLVNILKDYIPENPVCLELFARYLLPGWTSCGDEVLRLQQQRIFT